MKYDYLIDNHAHDLVFFFFNDHFHVRNVKAETKIKLMFISSSLLLLISDLSNCFLSL